AWLKRYFNDFAWHSITTEQMLAHLKTHLFDKYPGHMDWQDVAAWIHAPGIPADAPVPASAPFDAIDRQREAFLKAGLPASRLRARDWNTQEWMYFLDGLPTRTRRERILA